MNFLCPVCKRLFASDERMQSHYFAKHTRREAEQQAKRRKTDCSDHVNAAPITLLTVGDGNLSLSRAIARALTAERQRFQLVATTYDSEADLLGKYREASKVLEDLRHRSAVAVLHGVDATALDLVLPRLATNDPTPQLFQHVIFNFPHCGEDNVVMHQSLLAHYLHSAQNVLSAGGQIHVTLCNDQPEKWTLLQQAERVGLTLLRAGSPTLISHTFDSLPTVNALPVSASSTVDSTLHWANHYGYEFKRHQIDKSFPVQSVFEYIFIKGTASVKPCPSTIMRTECSICGVNFESDDDLAVHLRSQLPPADSGAVVQKPLRFNAATVALKKQLHCPVCDKLFQNQRALDQHQSTMQSRSEAEHVSSNQCRCIKLLTTTTIVENGREMCSGCRKMARK